MISTLLATAALATTSDAQTTPLSERHLPDALTLNSGKKVTIAAQWPARRRELLELFRTHIYGRTPVQRPFDLKFRVENSDAGAMNGAATLKQIAIEYGGLGGRGKIHLTLFVPNNRQVAAPTFLLLSNRSADNIDPTRHKRDDFWPAEEIVARGYAAAAFSVSDVDPDEDDGFHNGAHGIFDVGKRADDAWGTIAAWSWGASRVMDYLETDADIDASRVAVIGHSRGGKAALWAGAEDQRFALVISNESGSTGAALARGKSGETIAQINKTFPHWFSINYKKYNRRESDLPVDQHELIALIAPRPVYIASAMGDKWSDPQAEFLSGLAATPVYELLGKRGLVAEKFPALGAALHEGFIGYHVRAGKHDLMLSDWQMYLDFADQRMTAQN